MQKKPSGRASDRPAGGRARKREDEPLSTRELVFEGRIADLQQKIRELDESRSALSSQLRALATREAQIEHIHHGWVEIFDAIVDPIFMHDREGRIVRANRAYADMAGMDIRQVIGKLYWHVFPAGSGPLPSCTLTLSEHQEYAEEDVALDKGQIFRCRYFTLRDPAGGYLASLHIMTDVSERRHMEISLKQERDFTSAVMQTLGALVVVLDRDGCIVQFNHACEAVTGYSFAEIEGKPLWDALLLPEEIEPVRAVFNSLREGLFPNEHENYWRTRDGGRRLIHWSNTALTDANGSVQYVLATGIDVTDHRAAERAVRDSEARFRNLVETTSDMVWEVDENSRYTYVSPRVRELLGYEPWELLGRTPFDLMPPKEAGRIREIFASHATGRQAFTSLENTNLHKDGRLVVLESGGVPFFDETGTFRGYRGIDRDVTERQRAEESLRKVNRALRTLSGCNESLVHALDEQELLAAICQVIVDTGGYRFAWVGYAEHDAQKSVRPMAFAGEEAGFLDATRFSWSDDETGRNPIGEVIRSGVRQGIRDIAGTPALLPREEALRRGFASCTALPLRQGDQAMGVLAIYASEVDAFDEGEEKLLMELADDLSYGIVALRTRGEREHAMEENRQHNARLQQALIETIEAIGSALEKRDPYTAGHQRQVAKLAHAIAQEMKLPQEVVEGIYMGGLIHDVGKIYVPAEILNRPGKLSEAEFNLIKTHPQVGYEIIQGIEFPWPVAQMILQHHERLDGSGYPQGLKGDAISLEARILAVADVVEAMASHRPYRAGLGIDKALEEISQKREVLYDPRAVDTCLWLFREQGFSFDA